MKYNLNSGRCSLSWIEKIAAFLLFLLFVVQVPVIITNAEENEMEEAESAKIVSLFPRLSDYWVGDVMPMTDGDQLRLYYLRDDESMNRRFMNPNYSFATDNFYEFYDGGVTIEPSNDRDAQDFYGFGTGSYIKEGEVYHCWFTGINADLPQTTAVMHAVSTDGGKNWEKKLEDSLYPPEGYNNNEFRDPQVIWCEEANEYWMTVSARCNTNGQENGVVLLYTSDDLSNWTIKGNLFEPNHYYMLECSDIRKIGDQYYLFYSWNCITYYAVSDSIYGPYRDPSDNILSSDSFTFYAAKSGELDGHYYLCGWLGRKIGEKDTAIYDWGGNMVIFEMFQKQDGTLALDMPHTYTDYFNKDFVFKPVSTSGNVSVEENNVTLLAENGISYVDMGELPQTMLLTCKFSVDSGFTQAGFCFGTNGVSGDSRYIMINAKDYCVEYDGRTLSNIGSGNERVGSKVTYCFEPGKEYTLKIVVEDDIIAFYINGEKTAINRIYAAPGKDFGIFASNSGITFSDIQISVTDAVTTVPGVPAEKKVETGTVIDYKMAYYLDESVASNDGDVIKKVVQNISNGYETILDESMLNDKDTYQLFWAAEKDATLTIPIEIPVSGKYDIKLCLHMGGDFGTHQIYIGDTLITASGDIDLYRAEGGLVDFELGDFELTAGETNLLIRCTGQNEASAGSVFGISNMTFTCEAVYAAGTVLDYKMAYYFDESYASNETDGMKRVVQNISKGYETITDEALLNDEDIYQLFWAAQKDATLTIPIEIPFSGRYNVKLCMHTGGDFGTYQIYIGDTLLTTSQDMDLYSEDGALTNFKLGAVELPAGEMNLLIRCTGQNESSAGSVFGISTMTLTCEEVY